MEITGIARLTWEPAGSGGEQRVDITMFRDGFQTGDFTTFGPLPPDQTKIALTSGDPGLNYYWRVLTQSGSGWVSSAIGRLPWPICPTDSVSPPGETDLRRAPDGVLEEFEEPEAPEDSEVFRDFEDSEGSEDFLEPDDLETLEGVDDFDSFEDLEALGSDSWGIEFEDVNPDQSSRYNDRPDAFGSGGRVNGLASVPNNNSVFYAASEWGGIYQTGDGGLTWEHLDGHLPAVTWDIEVNPAQSRIVYATSFYDGRVESIAGINLSFDRGQTWEHPRTATPPRPRERFRCDEVSREEPSAFGISIDPDSPDSVYVGFNCGLAISRNRGRTWRFVDPEQSVNPDPAAVAAAYRDVVAHHDEQGRQVVDVCGDEGHFRSLDGGRTWRVGTGLPPGLCSIAVSPDESYVLIAVVGTLIFQSVNGGENWVQNINNPSPQGRIPFVATNQRSAEGGEDVFDLWFGDVQLHRFRCTTPAVREPGGAPRCPANPAAIATTGAHVDVGDLGFDSQVTSDACPLIFSSDGGVYPNTLKSSPACHNPEWNQPDKTPHGLWLWTMAGADQSGSTEEDLYFGTQDNGIFGTAEGGGPMADLNADWSNAECCDVFSIAATPKEVLWDLCCFIDGTHLMRTDRDLRTGLRVIFPDNPGGISGSLLGFLLPDPIDQWGEQRFALVTRDCFGGAGCVLGARNGDGGLFITSDNGITWTELGHATEPPTALVCAVRAAFVRRTNTPVFYAQVGSCQTDNRQRDQLWKFVGTDPNGRWQRVRLPRERRGAGISIFAVDHSDANRLYASLIIPDRNPRIIFSNNGGRTWRRDRRLDRLMQGLGTFRYQTRQGPTLFTGFNGYPQPSLLAFDPEDRNLLIAGGHDSAVFLSRDRGRSWQRVTDPFDPVGSGIPHLTSPRFAYFDHDPPTEIHVYIGTVGRGVWRMAIPKPPQRLAAASSPVQ